MKSLILLGALGLGLIGAAALYPVEVIAKSPAPPRPPTLDPPAPAPTRSLRLLFVHHSVGGQLLADPGSGELPAQAYRAATVPARAP